MYRDDEYKPKGASELVAAYTTCDSFYMRARVCRVTSREVELFFIDYGESETVKFECVRPLADEHARVEPFAFHCTLHGVEGTMQSGNYSADALKAFTRLVSDDVKCERARTRGERGSGDSDLVAVHLSVRGRRVDDRLVRAGHARFNCPQTQAAAEREAVVPCELGKEEEQIVSMLQSCGLWVIFMFL